MIRSPRMTHASPHKVQILRSLAMRATRFLRCPSDPREEPHILMTAMTRATRSFQHSHAPRASKRVSPTHVHSCTLRGATSCTGGENDCACGADAGPPPACGPSMATTRPALRNARSGRARAPKAPPEWKGRPSAQRGQACILMAERTRRRNTGNASISVKSRGLSVFASGAGSRATCNKGGLLCVANARARAGSTMEGSGRWGGRAGDAHATPHLEARAPGERVTAAHGGGPSRFPPASTLAPMAERSW